MIKRKYIKILTMLIVFIMTFSFDISINMTQSGTSSSPNKHFLQLGIGEVEAAEEWIDIGTKQIYCYHYSEYDYFWVLKVVGSNLELRFQEWVYSEKKDKNVIQRDTLYKTWPISQKQDLKLKVILKNIDVSISGDSHGAASFTIGDRTWSIISRGYNYPPEEHIIRVNKITAENPIYVCAGAGYCSNAKADVSISYMTNITPTLTITQPTPNSPLQGRYAHEKGAA